MKPSEQQPDVIIIGGGLAGLAAATLLARQQKSVRLFEQSHALGGRARTKSHDGFHLNIGPHALYRGGSGYKVLKELGVEPRGGIPSVSGAFAIDRGVKHTFPAGLVSLLTTGLFGLSAKLEATRLLVSLPKIDGNQAMAVTVREWVDENISQPRVRDLLLALFRLATYVNAPDQMSAGVAIEQLKKAFDKSVLYLDGGWQTLVDALAEAARSAGVIIEAGAKVESVERSYEGAVRRVRLGDGRAFDASTVVIASSPQLAVALVEGGHETSLARWAEVAIPVRAACLDLALGSLPKPKATFALGVDAPLYLSVHSAAAHLAPAGGAMIHVAKYLPPGDSQSSEAIERELENILDLVQPGWQSRVVQRRFLPDMTVMNWLTTAEREGTKGRPGPHVPDVPGLFVVGDWVGEEGLLADASLASAKRASELIVNQRPISLKAVS